MLYVVCGYPASGKSTFCREQVRHSPQAIMFDMDTICSALTAADDHDQRMTQSIGRMLNDIAHQMEDDFAAYGIPDMYMIRMCPTDTEMEAYLMREDVIVLMLDTPKKVCLERAQRRGDFDLQAFGRACGRVDRFAARFADSYTGISPPVYPPKSD